MKKGENMRINQVKVTHLILALFGYMIGLG